MYPETLFEFLATTCASHALAWDCATGNGQAARSLARHFSRVIATDASAKQIESATPADGVEFRVARAEKSGLAAGSVDLVTVAQALHWFDIEAFFLEAQRVLRPDGVVAFWCYQNCTVDAHCDAVVRATFDEVEDYWPPERDIVDNQYPHIPMPFDEISVPPQTMCLQWRAGQLLAYMNTWSATQRCLAATGSDPVGKHAAALLAAWGPGERTVCWPLVLRAGRRRA